MSNLFWLNDQQLARIEAAIPKKRPGVKPRRNREVISGIIHVLKIGCRWEDCPADYGPYTTIYNRFNRWSKSGIWAGTPDIGSGEGPVAAPEGNRTHHTFGGRVVDAGAAITQDQR